MLWLIGVMLVGLGVLMLARPDWMWEMTRLSNEMKGVNSERTEMWECNNGISAIVLIGLGLVTFYFAADFQQQQSRTQTSLTAIANMSRDMATDQAIRALTPSPTPAPDEIGTVTRVIDGDTIEVEIAGEVRRVRYLGIDAPALDADCGEEAASMNRELVQGKTVWLFRDLTNMDADQRLLRYVYAGDTFVNLEMIRRGYAAAITIPPDTDFFMVLEEAEDEAIRPCAW